MYEFGRRLGQQAIDAAQANSTDKLRMQQLKLQMQQQIAEQQNRQIENELASRIQQFREQQFGYVQERDIIDDVFRAKELDLNERLNKSMIDLRGYQEKYYEAGANERNSDADGGKIDPNTFRRNMAIVELNKENNERDKTQKYDLEQKLSAAESDRSMWGVRGTPQIPGPAAGFGSFMNYLFGDNPEELEEAEGIRKTITALTDSISARQAENEVLVRYGLPQTQPQQQGPIIDELASQ